MSQPGQGPPFLRAILVCWVMSAGSTDHMTMTRIYGIAAMKKAAFFGAVLGCLVMFACGAGLCCFLLTTYWLAPAQASFQRELFFDYTQTEAVAVAHLCPAVPTQVRMNRLVDRSTQDLPTQCLAPCYACIEAPSALEGSAGCMSMGQ